jgi:hypothetical protein
MPRKRWDRDVLSAIEGLAVRGWGASEILEELALRPEIKARLPGLRTIQRMVGRWAPDDDAWTLPPDAEPDSRFMLDVLRDVFETTKGRVRTISASDADWIRSVHTAAPDLDPWRTYLLARSYAALRHSGQSTARLDLALAFTPWRSPDHLDAYLLAVPFVDAPPATPAARSEIDLPDEAAALRAIVPDISRDSSVDMLPDAGRQPHPDLTYVENELLLRIEAKASSRVPETPASISDRADG